MQAIFLSLIETPFTLFPICSVFTCMFDGHGHVTTEWACVDTVYEETVLIDFIYATVAKANGSFLHLNTKFSKDRVICTWNVCKIASSHSHIWCQREKWMKGYHLKPLAFVWACKSTPRTYVRYFIFEQKLSKHSLLRI